MEYEMKNHKKNSCRYVRTIRVLQIMHDIITSFMSPQRRFSNKRNKEQNKLWSNATDVERKISQEKGSLL